MSSKRMSFMLPLLCLFVLIPVSNSQSSTPSSARRDTHAVQVVEQALTAMGGSSVWLNVVDSVTTLSCSTPANRGGVTSTARWITKGREFRYESAPEAGGPVFLSAHGKPGLSGASKNITLASDYYLRMRPYHLPGLALQSALGDSHFAFLYMGNQMLQGVLAVHVRIEEHLAHIKAIGSEQDWLFDPTSGLPLQVSYSLPMQIESQYASLTWTFGNWGNNSGLYVPTLLTQFIQGQLQIQTCTLNAVKWNTHPADSTFDAR